MKRKLLFTLVSVILSNIAFAGVQSSGGGADDFRPAPAFFLAYGNRQTVRICVEPAPEFGVKASELKKMVSTAFEKWAAYIPLKKLDILASDYVIQTQYSLMEKCDGSENLKVYFGTEDETVKTFRNQFTRPFGFAQVVRKQADPNKLDSYGIIWIAPTGFVDPKEIIPSWTEKNRDVLGALVLHEMGHVFGNQHVHGTVMTGNIAEYLEEDSAFNSTPKNLPRYQEIDSMIELITCIECKTDYPAAETYASVQSPDQPASDWAKAFRLLSGRDPVGKMELIFRKLGQYTGDGALILRDSTEEQVYRVTVLNRIGGHKDSAPLFKHHGRRTFYSLMEIYAAEIVARDGTKLSVSLNYNSDEHKVMILPAGPLVPYYPTPLFVSRDGFSEAEFQSATILNVPRILK